MCPQVLRRWKMKTGTSSSHHLRTLPSAMLDTTTLAEALVPAVPANGTQVAITMLKEGAGRRRCGESGAEHCVRFRRAHIQYQRGAGWLCGHRDERHASFEGLGRHAEERHAHFRQSQDIGAELLRSRLDGMKLDGTKAVSAAMCFRTTSATRWQREIPALRRAREKWPSICGIICRMYIKTASPLPLIKLYRQSDRQGRVRHRQPGGRLGG